MIDDVHLIENLLHHNLLTQSQIDHAKSIQQDGVPLYNTLLDEGIGREEDILAVAAKVLGIPYVNLSKFEYDRDAVSSLSKSMAERNTVFPLTIRQTDVGQELILAMTDPLDIMTMDEIATHTGVDIQPVIASPRDIRDAIEHAYTNISQTLERVDPFANLQPMGDPPKNPEDSWAAFFTDANAELITNPKVPVIPAAMHEEQSLGLFDDSINLAQAPSEPIDVETPKQSRDTNMFGKFFMDEASQGEQDFNGTMLGSPFRPITKSPLALPPVEQPPEEQPPVEQPPEEQSENNDFDQFMFFGEAKSAAMDGSEAHNLIELSHVQNNSTQIAGFKHHEIPRSNPRAKKIASLKKKLKQPTPPGPILPAVPPMNMDVKEAMDFDSIAEEAAAAANDVMDEAHHTNTDSSSVQNLELEPVKLEPVEKVASTPEESKQPSALANTLGKLQLKKMVVPNDKPKTLQIVEKTKALPPVPPMPTLAKKPSVQPSPEKELNSEDVHELELEEVSEHPQTSESYDLVEIIADDELPLIEVEPLPLMENLPLIEVEPLPLNDSKMKNPFGISRAITGSSSTAVPEKPSTEELEIVEDESELDFDPDFDFELDNKRGLDQATEANAKVTIEYAQQMHGKNPQPNLPTREVGSALDALSDAQLVRALVQTLVARGILTESEILANADDED